MAARCRPISRIDASRRQLGPTTRLSYGSLRSRKAAPTEQVQVAVIPLVSPDRQKAFLAFLTPDLFPSTFDDNPGLRFELRPVDDCDLELVASARKPVMHQLRHAAASAWAAIEATKGLTELQRERGLR